MYLTNPDKLIFPDDGFTKTHLVGHYASVADRMVPHLAGRPLTLERYPNGIAAKGFMQKNAPDYFPEFIERVIIPRGDGEETVYPVVHDAEGLVYLANQGTVTFHIWPARLPALGRPDRVIFDVDPPEHLVEAAAPAARLIADVLGEVGLDLTPVATGSKGYHLVASILPQVDSADVAGWAQLISAIAASVHDEVLTVEFQKKNRRGRVFVDWLRNGGMGPTVAAPWSLRPLPGAPVVVPFPWADLESTPPGRWHLDTLPADMQDVLAGATVQDLRPVMEATATWAGRIGVTPTAFDRFRS